MAVEFGRALPHILIALAFHSTICVCSSISYQHHEESGYSKVRFGVADLFLRCKKQGESAAESCVLKPMGSSVSLKDDEIVWSIPAGMKAHSSIVSAVTFTSALLSAVGIIVTSFRSNPN
ncbi:unnamed protein product [Cuscuta epithymum]|uniref:Uncharacterized protein n=1 Tax=Cuscuta epithymum TaxID=186058 RepID=A0AAV0DKA8_9ASTE|nr:unnamed protein product [Cuscuta epithymum]